MCRCITIALRAHKAEVEAPYHELTRGGHIFYVEIDGDATHNPEAISDIVDLMDKYNIGMVRSIITVTDYELRL